MKEKNSDLEEEITSIVQVEDMTIDEIQLAEQLYYSAGLDPIVDAGIKDYDKKIEQENKLINKVFGTRGSDIRGYGESVARRVSFAIYSLLNKQYGGKVGDMRSYIMSLEDEVAQANKKYDDANRRYDDLMGRAIGILGDEYKELRTDSKEFIEKLTKTLGDDLKDAKIDQKALAERLADIDGLRSQISIITKEKEQLKQKHEAQTAELKNSHKEEIRSLESQIKNMNKEQAQLTEKHEVQVTKLISEHKEEIKKLESQIENLNIEQAKLQEKHEAQVAELRSEYKGELRKLESQIEILNKENVQLTEKYEAQVAELNSSIKGLEADKATLSNNLEQLKTGYKELKVAISLLAEAVPGEELGKKMGEDLYTFILKDSKVPSAVLKGVDQFIDFKKYLGMAVENGAKEVCKRIEKILGTDKQA